MQPTTHEGVDRQGDLNKMADHSGRGVFGLRPAGQAFPTLVRAGGVETERPTVDQGGRKNITYGQFTQELEDREVDTSRQSFGVAGWFQEIQSAGGDFPRYLELVGGPNKRERIGHSEAVAILLHEAGRA